MPASVVKGCLELVIFLVTLFAALLLYIFWVQYKINVDNEQRIQLALRSNYPTDTIRIIRMVKFPKEDWDYFSQICFEFTVENGSGSRRFAMVQSDKDQGHWTFAQEYGSIQDCVEKFDHG